MIRDIFKRNRKKNELTIPSNNNKNDVPEGIMTKCPECKKNTLTKELVIALKVCPNCDHHFRMTAAERVAILFDEDSFESIDDHLKTVNPLNFPAYTEKVEEDAKKTGLNEAVLTGTGKIDGREVAVAIMDSHFRMGSMGSVVGEKITRAIEKATESKNSIAYFYSKWWRKNARRGSVPYANGENKCCIESSFTTWFTLYFYYDVSNNRWRISKFCLRR